MKKPNLNTIIADNLNKTTHVPNKGMSGLPNKKATVPFVSNEGYKNGLPPVGSHYRIPSDTLYNPTPYRIKATPNNGPSKWLEAYDTSNTQFPGADYVDEQHYDTGGYISDKAKATQFGQYAEGGSSWMLTNPNRISTYFPRMANGGGLLSRTVTCSNCGWSWKAVDGGMDPMTCHKCGGTIKMKNGGDISIPDLQEGNWLKAYGPGGQTTDGCPPGYNKHPILGTCIPNGWTASVKQELGPTVANAKSLNEKIVAQQRANSNYIKPGKQGQQATLGVDRSNEPWRQRQVADIKKYEAMKNSELAQTMASFTPSGSNTDAGVIGAENFVNMNPITGPAASTGRITQAALGQNPYGFDNSGISWNNALAGLGVLGDATFAYAGLKPVKVSKPTSTQRITRGPINYWEEPNFAARNPKFNPNSYANSVNKFGNTSGNIQPEMMPRLSSSYPPTPKQSSLFAFGNSEMFTNPKQYFTKPSAGATYTPNYENIKKAASQGRDPFAETLSLGTYTPAPRVLDWKKIGKTAVGFGIGSGLVSGASKYKEGGSLPKAQDGFGCTGKSKCITGSDQKKKDGISGGYIGGMDNIVPLSNAPINYDELTKYVDDQYTDRSSKKQRQAEYAQAAQIYPGLTKNDFYASQAEASRLNSRINDIPTWDKPENQTYDRAWYPYYRSIIQPGVKVNSSQILKFISGQPGGLGGYRQTVESNYGLKKNKYGGWLSQYADEGMEVTTETTNPSYGKAFEYVVKAGDNLSKISRNTGLSVKQISQANNIFDPNKIRINQKLMLPAVGGNQPAQSYQKWEDIKARQDAMNNLQDNADYSGNEQRISQYYLNRPEESYVVVDKQRGRMNYYKGNKLIKSYEVGVGENLGDAQTVTKVNPKTGKTDWNAGNKSTGAGVYSISNINPASKEYYGLPSFNMKNDQGIEVATSIHGTPASRRVRFGNNNVQDNRMSNGCINGRCEDLPDMFKRFDIGNKVYVLPEDQGNRFQIVDGKPVLRVPSANRAKYNKYVDRTGTSQKGQGVNQTVKTLQYKPTIGYLDKKLFKNDVYQWNDFNDEEEFNKTTKPYFSALVNNKKKIMEATNIPSDVYNEIAKMSFGIYGTESNFGDTHSAVGNFARAIAKLTNSSSSSSPDYKSKATTYGADSDNNSVGLTQIRWSQLNNDEKGALKKLGITSNKDFLDAEKSAIATTAILALRYSQQLTEDQKKDIWKYLPTKWNSRGNYAKRVKNNSKYLTFKQLDDNLKMGGETNGWLTKHL